MIKIFNLKNWELNEKDYKILLNKIENLESERISKFKFMIDSIRSLSGLLISKIEISKMLELPIEEICFYRSENNKPIFHKENFPSIDFNISHSGNLVTVIISKNYSVGIDIEKIEKNSPSLHNFLKYFLDCFTDFEWNQILGNISDIATCDLLNEEQQNEILKRFYLNWTLKESFIKCIGKGLSYDLKQIEFKIEDVNIELYINNEISLQFKFKHFFLNEGEYVCSYCIEIKNDDFIFPTIDYLDKNYFNYLLS
jgi:4'-phosphopantetheinyl transferase